MQTLITVNGQSVRTDWIERVVPGKEHGTATCSIWFSVGPVGAFHFEGKEAENALELLAAHPSLRN